MGLGLVALLLGGRKPAAHHGTSEVACISVDIPISSPPLEKKKKKKKKKKKSSRMQISKQ